jgi:hypothetical protein
LENQPPPASEGDHPPATCLVVQLQGSPPCLTVQSTGKRKASFSGQKRSHAAAVLTGNSKKAILPQGTILVSFSYQLDN